jgi:hypothetical protein
MFIGGPSNFDPHHINVLLNHKDSRLSSYFFLKKFCRCAPFGYLYFSFYYQFEPELGAEIDSGMAFTPFPSSLMDEI